MDRNDALKWSGAHRRLSINSRFRMTGGAENTRPEVLVDLGDVVASSP